MLTIVFSNLRSKFENEKTIEKCISNYVLHFIQLISENRNNKSLRL